VATPEDPRAAARRIVEQVLAERAPAPEPASARERGSDPAPVPERPSETAAAASDGEALTFGDVAPPTDLDDDPLAALREEELFASVTVDAAPSSARVRARELVAEVLAAHEDLPDPPAHLAPSTRAPEPAPPRDEDPPGEATPSTEDEVPVEAEVPVEDVAPAASAPEPVAPPEPVTPEPDPVEPEPAVPEPVDEAPASPVSADSTARLRARELVAAVLAEAEEREAAAREARETEERRRAEEEARREREEAAAALMESAREAERERREAEQARRGGIERAAGVDADDAEPTAPAAEAPPEVEDLDGPPAAPERTAPLSVAELAAAERTAALETQDATEGEPAAEGDLAATSLIESRDASSPTVVTPIGQEGPDRPEEPAGASTRTETVVVSSARPPEAVTDVPASAPAEPVGDEVGDDGDPADVPEQVAVGGDGRRRVLEATIDVPEASEQRRPGRWLVASVIGAISLAVLFPLAVQALRALVALS
jgi:hypothetical protein